jgi:hypothetical protein
MATQSSAALGDNSGIDSDLLLAQSTRVPDLPGAFKKKAVINPEETGMITSNGSVSAGLSWGSEAGARTWFAFTTARSHSGCTSRT